MLIAPWLACAGDGPVKAGFVKAGNDSPTINEWVISLELVSDHHTDSVLK